jgi:hypothetical protein
MIVVHDYRGYRIHVEAVAADGRWNVEVRIRRTFSGREAARRAGDLKLTAQLAEMCAVVWARGWVDLNGDAYP